MAGETRMGPTALKSLQSLKKDTPYFSLHRSRELAGKYVLDVGAPGGAPMLGNLHTECPPNAQGSVPKESNPLNWWP